MPDGRPPPSPPDAGWPFADSPFHAGERGVQTRLGIRDRVEGIGRRFIRDYLPEQHRAFFAMLPFLLIGSVDRLGRPWASILAGPTGFISSPDPRRLVISARPPFGDPLSDSLSTGAQVGLLGLQPETRRRNRVTGRVSARTAQGFEIEVGQTFGNCPQYIQTRSVTHVVSGGGDDRARPFHAFACPDTDSRALIERADTFFIATAALSGDDRTLGADVSHRGGKPGFVGFEDASTLVFPDYSGNLHFNTIGNIALDPRAGLLFIDFETGDLVYLTGRATVVWDGEEVRAFQGAERLIRFQTEQGFRVEGSLPLRFAFGEFSPFVQATGTWSEAQERMAANRERDTYARYVVDEVRQESETITSFSLRRADRRQLASYDAGQFLPIRLMVPGPSDPVLRTYTLSAAPNQSCYRLSIKREPDGLVSRFFHDQVRPGFEIEALAPRGRFVLDQTSDRPVGLISGGVGITPMLAMADFLIDEGQRTRQFRRTYFIHGTTNGRTLAFGPHLRALARVYPSFTLHVRFSRPDPDDGQGAGHDSVGRIDMVLLQNVLPLGEVDCYLCGPTAFMQDLYDGLISWGVPDTRIRYEAFGTATVVHRNRLTPPVPGVSPMAAGPVAVRFAASGIDAEWSPEKGTLLDLAEAAGLHPNYGCRAGVCGSCATRLACGSVDYRQEPVGPRGDDEVLICCSTPRSTAGAETCGSDQGVILDL
jgi:hypothetical protein